MSDDETFEQAGADGALTYPIQCSALRKNGYAMLKGKPCKIIDMSTSKTGKHGHAKVNLTGIDIFDGKKYEDMSPSTHNMEVPNVSRQEYNVVDVIDDGFIHLMDDQGEIREDLHCNHSDATRALHAEIKEKFDDGQDLLVTVIKALGREMPLAIKNISSNK